MDRYDQDVTSMTAFYEQGKHEKILHACGELLSPLFAFCTPTGKGQRRPDGKRCGCPVMVKSSDYVAWTDELTDLIRADNRIPVGHNDFTPKSFVAMAELQRHIDKVLGRKPPPLKIIP
jgi:hypothetical protein